MLRVLVSWLLVVSTALADDSLKYVVPVRDASLKVVGQVVGTVPAGLPQKVRGFDGTWYWVSHVDSDGMIQGYLHRKDVLSVDEAIKWLEKRNLEQPTFFANEVLGMLWEHKGDYVRAIEYHTEALRLIPDRGDVLNNRGIAHVKIDSYDAAIADYTRAIELEGSVVTITNRGYAWLAKGNTERAIQDFNEAIRLHPEVPDAYNGRGWVWFHRGEQERAIADVHEAMRLDTKDTGLQRSLSHLLSCCHDESVGRFERAIHAAVLVCEANHWSRDTDFDALATAYADAGDFQSATKWEAKAVKVAVENAELFQIRLDLYKRAINQSH